jgi:hypothetical protein
MVPRMTESLTDHDSAPPTPTALAEATACGDT